jgi:four helix bundle protein
VGSSFRELTTYKLATRASSELRAAVSGWSSFDKWSLGMQLVRAADSIGANIAEGCGRWSGPDERRFLFIARASLYEAEHWLLTAVERGLLPSGSEDLLDDLARALAGQIKAHSR